MGAKHREPFQLSLNGSLWVDFQGSRVSPDDSLFLVREFDERLGFSELIAQHLTEPRRGKNTPRPVADLLRQSVYSRLAGYEDVNGASETTIKRHRAWVMQQMGAESLTEMVRTVEKLDVPSTTYVPESTKKS